MRLINILEEKKIKIEGEKVDNEDLDNPDEIEIEDSDDEEKKPKNELKDENQGEEEDEDDDYGEPYDTKMDPNLEDFDPGEIQESRMSRMDNPYSH